MTNEELKKLGNYCNQMHQFSLGLEDEMRAMQNDEWTGFAVELVAMWERMNESLKSRTKSRG